MSEKPEDFYERLKEKLEEQGNWPGPYLYKFIIPADSKSLAIIEEHFDGTDAKIETRQSSTGKFTSISIRVTLKNPQEVIDKYMAVSTIEGLISL